MPQAPDPSGSPSAAAAAAVSRSSSGLADSTVVGGIRRAARAANVDFGYLMAQAARESGFQPDAASTTSSATGLFQFVESTWLDMVQRHGAKHGLGDLAQQIETRNGRPTVADPALRQRILDLRNDPGVSACFAAELAHDNKEELTRALGRPVGSADLYLAHFLGAGGACQFLRAVETDGGQKAADLLPDAAAANRGVFYDRQTGAARSVAEVYRSLAGQIEGDRRRYAGTAAGAATAGDASSAAVADALSGATSADHGVYAAMLGFRQPTDGTTAAAAASSWAAGKLSEQTLAMLNILALSMLRTADGTGHSGIGAAGGDHIDSGPRPAATPAAAPHRSSGDPDNPLRPI
ncbi:MAG TPA: transglycosylase SLT domain-containing protein [Stellaceae bacterium]